MKRDKMIKLLSLTDTIAEDFSKDQSTKVGAVIVNSKSLAPLSFGYNGMPRGLDDENKERNERPEKYFWFEHAERNAIYHIARDVLEDTTMFVNNLPKMESARAIVSSGISTVVVKEFNLNNYSEEVRKDLNRTLTLFKETGVDLVVLPNDMINVTDKKLIKLNKYLNLANKIGKSFSKDLDNEAGSIILNSKTLAPISFGYSGMPRGIDDTVQERLVEPEKSFWVEDSEKNAIFNAIREKLEKATLFANFIPCMHCARAIVGVGIKELVTKEPDLSQDKDQRWKASFDRSIKLFKEAGVNVQYIKEHELNNEEKIIKKNKIKC
jgi:dCMP deaminase